MDQNFIFLKKQIKETKNQEALNNKLVVEKVKCVRILRMTQTSVADV